jgi:hypothetical protein
MGKSRVEYQDPLKTDGTFEVWKVPILASNDKISIAYNKHNIQFIPYDNVLQITTLDLIKIQITMIYVICSFINLLPFFEKCGVLLITQQLYYITI